MIKKRILALVFFVVSLAVGFLLVAPQINKKAFSGFTLGLDLSGGSRLTYDVDTSSVTGNDTSSALGSLREVVEKRVNTFGVSEPVVFLQSSGVGSNRKHRLVAELPSVANLETAKAMIGDTPILEFKTLKPGLDTSKLKGDEDPNTVFVDTGLTGKLLKKAQVQFSQGIAQGGNGMSGSPLVSITFNKEGTELFAKITKENMGKPVAIFLDGQVISAPVVQAEIVTGQAVITGNFTLDEAETLTKRLNAGALPLPISLTSSEVIQPVLGADALHDSIVAGIVAFLIIVVFMTLWYRLPGFLASMALITYAVIVMALFKYLPVTLSTAGIAGFIISIGIAVDANILIFERTKEELLKGKAVDLAFLEGFARAWPSIRDSNISSLISAFILFTFGTSIVKGFALTFGLGVIVSMMTAIGVTRLYVRAFASQTKRRWLVLSGLSNK